MLSLSNKNLVQIKAKSIKIPSYNRVGLKPSLVHIGLGAFHRAHYLSYIEKLMREGVYTEGVYEIDIIPSKKGFVEALEEQDYLYTLLTKDPFGHEELEVRGGIANYANASSNPKKVLDILSSKNTKLITLTVTEKGYCYDSENHKLDLNHPSIIKDLKSFDIPSSTIGELSEALKQRFEESKAPLTIMSCDNIPENGNMLKNCINEFLSIKYPEIVEWVSKKIVFPNTMVDRITPVTSDKDINYVAQEYGIKDICGVHSEDFITWVIEDVDIPEIQMFRKAGALVVESVLPYELMKIRLLNGSHSALSYPSYLLGYRDVDDGINDPLIKDFIRNHYMEEITKSLNSVPGVDLDEYKDELIERFSNKCIKDKLLRLASDGSKKISNAIVKPLLELKERDSLILALAFWASFLKGKDDKGNEIVIEDPNAKVLQEKIKDDKAFMEYNGIEEEEILKTYSSFKSQIDKEGVAATLKAYLN
ncbi:MAG: mannitol dehydrogenase family protein [Spirochaetaceae bacterium]|nr:mannitol dehydrogenase family protein [Spirochaetaceae bacterium]